MGILALSDLKDEVKRGLGNRGDMDARLTRFLNIAQSRVARLHEFDEMQRSGSGTMPFTGDIVADKFITLPSLREIHSFRLIADSRAIKLKGVSPRVFDKVVPQPEWFARDIPSHYTLWQYKMEIWPIADQAYPYATRYTVWPTTLDDGNLTAVSDLDHKDDLLIALALGYAFDSLSKNMDATRMYQQAAQLMNEAISMDAQKPDTEYAPTREVFGEEAFRPNYWQDPFLLGNPNGTES